MRFEDFLVKGNRGLYAMLQIKEIHIDFTKCKNNIIAIKGPNGCGKSSLIDILHIFPDSNDKFIPEEYGEKSGIIVDNSDRYYFIIKHPVNSKGVRQQTKAYIYKYINGLKMDMNPNGNISSYYEYIFNEMNLDPSFLTLTSLSISNKGIVDKTPADRKKYVNIIINSIEAYNGFLKTLNKRRSGIKSIMNNIVSKISVIGNEKEIELTLESLNNRLMNIMKEKDIKLQQLAESKSTIKILDPNGTIQDTYSKIYNDITEINKELSSIKVIIEKQESKINLSINEDNISSIHNEIKSNISEYRFNIDNNKNIIKETLDSRERESKELSEKSAKLDSMQMTLDENNIESEISDCKILLDEYKTIIDQIGIIDIFSISKEEFIIGLEALSDIKETILNVRSNLSPYIIEESSKYIVNGMKDPNIKLMADNLENLKVYKSELEIKYANYEALLKETDKLQGRDDNCTINTCSFIKGALSALEQKPQENLDIISKELIITSNDITKLTNDVADAKEIISGINYLKSICKYLNSNLSILRKLPLDMSIFGNDDYILNSIISGYRFDEIDYLYQYLQYANIIEEYKIQINRMTLLDKDYEIYIEKNKIADEILNDINTINTRIKDSTVKIEKLNNEVIISKDNMNKSEIIITYIEALIELYGKEDKLLEIKRNIISQYNTIKSNMGEIKICIDKVKQLESGICTLENQLKPLMQDRDKLNVQLSMTKEYKVELELFTKKIKIIDTLRKYCNPSEKGIQLLFIELYFYNTVKLANELLCLVFNGRYQLQKPIINGDEFRIPVTGNIMPCDDISSMSESQRSLIGVILSFVLLFQSSTNYNIVRLDEVDESLDTDNRLAFGMLLDDLIRRLGLEQLFYVSHNEEVVLENADIILLTDSPRFIEQFKNNNIIFSLVA